MALVEAPRSETNNLFSNNSLGIVIQLIPINGTVCFRIVQMGPALLLAQFRVTLPAEPFHDGPADCLLMVSNKDNSVMGRPFTN